MPPLPFQFWLKTLIKTIENKSIFMIFAINPPISKNRKQYGNLIISMESPDTMTESISMILILMPIFPWMIKRMGKQLSIFDNYSRSVTTGRDVWIYSISSKKLIANIQNSIQFYNDKVNRYLAQPPSTKIIKTKDLIKGKKY